MSFIIGRDIAVVPGAVARSACKRPRVRFPRPAHSFMEKSSCQLLAKECALSTGKLPKRLAQEQCG